MHPKSHPLQPVVVSEQAVWRCPVSGETLAEIGTLHGEDEDNDVLEAEDYEALTGVSKVEYEQSLLETARQIFGGRDLDGHLQSVELDDEASMLVVVFVAHHLPGRMFGWRVPIWPAPHPLDQQMGTSEGRALVQSIHLMELIDALPHAVRFLLDESGVEWVDPVW